MTRMRSDDNWWFKQNAGKPLEPGSRRYEEIKAIRTYEDEKRLQYENDARVFFENSVAFHGLMTAHEVDDATRPFIIDAAAAIAAERRAGGPIEPHELGRLLTDALAEGYKQHAIAMDSDIANEVEAQQEPQSDRGTDPTPGRANAYEELNAFAIAVNEQAAALQAEQQQESDRRQSLDPATQATNNLEPSRDPSIADLKTDGLAVSENVARGDIAHDLDLFDIDPSIERDQGIGREF
jgi:hypothetical protein